MLAATGTSSFGDGMVLVALPLLAVSLTSRPLLIAGVAVAGRLPWLLVSLPAGALADRVDRRRLVVGIEAIRAGVLLVLAGVILTGRTSLALIYVAAFVVGALETAFGAATRATIPALVAPSEIARANGYLYAADTAGEQFGGAAIGGVMFAWAPALPFFGDALSFAGSGALLATALPSPPSTRPPSTTSIRQDVADGWRWFRAHQSLRVLALVVTTFAFCQSVVMSVLVLYGLHVLHLTKAGYGLFLAIGGIGDVVGSLVAHRANARFGPARSLFIAGVAAAVGYLVLAMTANIVLAFIAYSLEAVAVALGNVTTLSLRHHLIPSELFGRVNNTFRMCVFGIVPIGALSGGLLAAGLGLPTTFLIAGALQLAVIIALLRRLSGRLTGAESGRKMRSLAPTSEAEISDRESSPGGSLSSGLPPDVEQWVEQVAGTISMLARHPARREAWLVDTKLPSGQTHRGFLRLDRPGVTASVNIEAEVVAALATRGIPVPAVYAANPALACALYERVDGEDSVAALPADEAQGVMEHFIDLVGAWHRLDARSLGIGLPWPATAEECALNRPNSLSALTGDPGVEPLRRFGKWWIGRHVPRPLPELVLLQGDTGPGNFIFSGGRIQAVTDWEWARFGDPMEDLGTICCRSLFFGPQVQLAPIFRRYEQASGIRLDLDRVRFYRAQQMVQSVIALTALTDNVDPTGPAALNLAYRVRGDFVCCDAIALAMGIHLEEPDLPEPADTGLAPAFDLIGPALQIIEQELVGNLTDPYLRERAQWSARLAETLERRSRLGPALVALEMEDLGALLGARPASVAAGLAELDRRIAGWGPSSAPEEQQVLGYLWRRACRHEHLYQPLLGFLPERRFSPIEES